MVSSVKIFWDLDFVVCCVSHLYINHIFVNLTICAFIQIIDESIKQRRAKLVSLEHCIGHCLPG